MRASLASFLQSAFVFHIDKMIESSATSVVFNNHHPDMRYFCLKRWRECHNEIYDIGDLTQQARYLLEGLAFNRQFSGDVCLGIVPVLHHEPDEIECGPLIEDPVFENLEVSRPYALVMKRLEDEWRLDQLLQSGKFGNVQGMEFLARQVAEMHKLLVGSSKEFGTPERIASKLEFNIEQFRRALDSRKASLQTMAESAFSDTEMAWIESAPMLLRQLSEKRWHHFEKRHQKHIKRCHGDLKASNLWICPSEDESQAPGRFIALDCVDFNSEFCNIDTLSDIAMLAVDLEMQLDTIAEHHSEKFSGRQLARYFLQTYLKAARENKTVWPLLEYYMAEKAMVCAYMSIVYDKFPIFGEKYLKVLLAHSQKLAKYLPADVSKRIPGSLFPIAN